MCKSSSMLMQLYDIKWNLENKIIGECEVLVFFEKYYTYINRDLFWEIVGIVEL